jgi:DNA transposition AAA+ family ATPase
MATSIKNYTGWSYMGTLQAKEILSELFDAKENRRAKLLIAPTGLGKTRTIEEFVEKSPKHTYLVTVGDSYKLVDVADEILIQIGVASYNTNTRIREKLWIIAAHMKEISAEGGKPVIIIDEAENLKPNTLRMMKELYDAIIKHCSMVMIGTEQIFDTIFNRRKRNRQGVPQLWRRFKAGTREISLISKARDFRPFFQRYIADEKGLQDLLLQICENYGELHDYLDPVLAHCSKQGKPLDEELFRLYHKIPAQQSVRIAKLRA